MSDFKAKMHQFDFCWGSAPADSAVGTYSAPPHPLVVRGYGKGEGRGKGREETEKREDEGRRRKGEKWERGGRKGTKED